MKTDEDTNTALKELLHEGEKDGYALAMSDSISQRRIAIALEKVARLLDGGLVVWKGEV